MNTSPESPAVDHASSAEPVAPRERWQKADSGSRYTGARWRSWRRRGNDPRLVARLLARHLEGGDAAMVLDVPCGTARLRPVIETHAARWVGLDVSLSMLSAAAAPAGALLRGDVEALPFADGAFEAVVCCRLLHHLHDTDCFQRTVNELVRVSRRVVLASFWDAASLPARHRRAFPHHGRRRQGRIAHAKPYVALAFAQAGAEVVGFRHTLRFFSRQTFVIAHKRAEHADG